MLYLPSSNCSCCSNYSKKGGCSGYWYSSEGSTSTHDRNAKTSPAHTHTCKQEKTLRNSINLFIYSSVFIGSRAHAIVVTRRIVLAQFYALFLCNDVLLRSVRLCVHECLCFVVVWLCDREQTLSHRRSTMSHLLLISLSSRRTWRMASIT